MGNQLSIPQFLIPELSDSQLSNTMLQLVPSMSIYELPPTPPMWSPAVVQTPETSHEEDSQLLPPSSNISGNNNNNNNNNNNDKQKKELYAKKLEAPSKTPKQKLPISRQGQQRIKMSQVTPNPQLPVENKISNNNNNNNNNDDDNDKHPAVDDPSTKESAPDAEASSTSTTFKPDLEGLAQYNKQMQELYGKKLEALTKTQKQKLPISGKGKLMKLSHLTMKTGHENAGGKYEDLEVIVIKEKVLNRG
jgi:hypothetical protein